MIPNNEKLLFIFIAEENVYGKRKMPLMAQLHSMLYNRETSKTYIHNGPGAMQHGCIGQSLSHIDICRQSLHEAEIYRTPAIIMHDISDFVHIYIHQICSTILKIALKFNHIEHIHKYVAKATSTKTRCTHNKIIQSTKIASKVNR